MKKLLFAIMAIASSIVVGQEKEQKFLIPKNTWNISGGLSLNNSNTKSEESKSDSFGFNFKPKIGYFFHNNLSAGIGLGYGYNNHSTNNDFQNETTTNLFSIFPYVKKHFSIGKKVGLFLQGEFRYSYAKNGNSYELTYKRINHSYFFGVRPGLTFLITKKLAIETSIGALGYSKNNSRYQRDEAKESSHNSFSFDLNSSNLTLGLSLFL